MGQGLFPSNRRRKSLMKGGQPFVKGEGGVRRITFVKGSDVLCGVRGRKSGVLSISLPIQRKTWKTQKKTRKTIIRAGREEKPAGMNRFWMFPAKKPLARGEKDFPIIAYGQREKRNTTRKWTSRQNSSRLHKGKKLEVPMAGRWTKHVGVVDGRTIPQFTKGGDATKLNEGSTLLSPA